MEILVDFIDGLNFKPNAVVQKSIVHDSAEVLDYSVWLDNPAIFVIFNYPCPPGLPPR